jgi:transposase
VRRNKTDAGDALSIAHAGRIASPLVSRVHLKSIECEALACRLKIRRHLNKARMDAVNLIRKQFQLFGVRIAAGSPATFNGRVEKEIGKTFGRTPNALAADLRHLLVQLLEACRTNGYEPFVIAIDLRIGQTWSIVAGPVSKARKLAGRGSDKLRSYGG